MTLRLAGILLSLIALLPSMAPPAAAQSEAQVKIKERELEEVRARIDELKERMAKRAAERDRLAAELEQAEVRIAETRTQLAGLERRKQASEQKLTELEGRIAAAEKNLEQEAAQLADQVRAAWMSGRQERLKLLLNQRDPAAVGRMLVYSRYLGAYRQRTIDAISARLDELAALSAEAARERDELAALAASRYEELTRLAAAQERREGLLAELKAKLAEEGAEVERLTAQEKDLQRLIAELATILSDYPITSEAPFSDLKGRLTWPVAGTLMHDFGEARANGAMKWNGVVLAAPRGREVRAVYHGRVAFADWLDGLGLLVIVDHGGGYLTLYGYNETTLKSAGDWVAPGDVIATVGSSGGQPEPALYFEIRRDAKPVDPHEWFTRRPGERRAP
jgi:septal ring factor EnvC (AmiA/AmiB activator)